MRKTICGLGQLIGILVAVAGLIVCMCDTADLDKLFVQMIIGLAIFLSGAGIAILAKEVGESATR